MIPEIYLIDGFVGLIQNYSTAVPKFLKLQDGYYYFQVNNCVITYERKFLRALGNDDLVQEAQWIAQNYGSND